MNGYGYQPKMRCNSCAKKNDCKKYKDGKEACKKYEACPPPRLPKSGSCVTPAFRKQVPMPEVKPAKQCTVLSVRDFAILYEIASRKLAEMEEKIVILDMDREEANHNPYYQDLLRIRDKLGELNIEVETPSVKVEE